MGPSLTIPRGGIVKPKCKKSSTTTGRPGRQKLRDTAVGPSCKKSETEMVGSEHDKPKASIDGPEQPKCCGKNVKPDRKRSSAGARAPMHAKLRGRSVTSGCVDSGTNTNGASLPVPDTSEAAPALPWLRRGIVKPEREGSIAKDGNSK